MRPTVFGRNKGLVFEAIFDTTLTKSGSSASNQIRIPLSISNFQPCTVKWDDGTESYISTYNSALLTKTFSTSGAHTVKIIGQSFSLLFNNGTETNKITSIEKNGGNIFVTTAFWNCINLTKIGDDVEQLNTVTNGAQMFRGTKITSLPSGVTLNNLTNGIAMFYGSKITSLPSGMLLSSLIDGSSMFATSLLNTLPSAMTLNSATTVVGMFLSTPITSLPSGMLLSNLTNGSQMFQSSLLNILPSGMTLNSLTNGTEMFSGTKITSLPSGMLLNNITNGTRMFQSSLLNVLPSGMALSSLTNGTQMYNNTKLTSLPSAMLLNNLTNGNSMFSTTLLSSLPSGMNLTALTDGGAMFQNTKITTLPSGMTLSNVTSGIYMFAGTLLDTLPSGMDLNNLTNGLQMFQGTKITSLPSGMLLNSLTNGTQMFQNTLLNILPSGMTLNSLTNGSLMFSGTKITSLPSGMLLSNLTNGSSMFQNGLLNHLSSGITLSKLTNGTLMFSGCTLSSLDYSQLLINMNSYNTNSSITFNGGNSKYYSSATSARNNLISTKLWAITDGGLAPPEPLHKLGLLGDSTISAYACRAQTISDILFTPTENTDGWEAFNLAVPGHTINQQLAVWNADANKATYDIIIIQVGLNDMNTTITTTITNYQNLVSQINSTKKAGAKVYISCMLPCKQRWTDLGWVNGQSNWVALNNAIMGLGATPITGVDKRNNAHVALLDDGSGNLAPAYDCGDHIHENAAGGVIIKDAFRTMIF